MKRVISSRLLLVKIRSTEHKKVLWRELCKKSSKSFELVHG